MKANVFSPMIGTCSILLVVGMDLFSMGEMPTRTYDSWLICFRMDTSVFYFIYGRHGFIFIHCVVQGDL
jgi:hypothetical protein